MKILFLTRSFYPNVGGVEKHILEVSKALTKRGHIVTVVTEDRKVKNKSEVNFQNPETFQGIAIYRIPISVSERKKKIQIWKWLWQNRDLFTNTDVIHAHDVTYWFLPFKLVFPAKKIFTTFHGYESFPIKKKAILYRKIFELLSTGTICVGDFMKKWYFAKPNIVTVGATNIPKINHKPKKNTAVFIGRLDEQTNIDMYANAVISIRNHIPQFTLTIYGDGHLKNAIKRQGVVLKGWTKNAEGEIEKYEFAFISRYLAILEALAAKRLVFALYDNPVKEDYLKLTPFKNWIITCNSVEKLVEEVVYYVQNKKETERKVEKAYAWVKNQSWENLADQYLLLWR